MKRDELAALNVPEEVIDKIMGINGADIEKQKKLTETAQSRLDTLTAELTTANTTISEMTAKMEDMQKSGADAEGLKKQLDEALAQAAQASETATKAQQEAAEQLKQRDYNDAITNYIRDKQLKFSSKYAEDGFISDFMKMGFKLEGDSLLGADDYLKQTAEKSPEIFAPGDDAPKLVVTVPGTPRPGEPPKEQKKPITFF
jgi:hypothetical protein